MRPKVLIGAAIALVGLAGVTVRFVRYATESGAWDALRWVPWAWLVLIGVVYLYTLRQALLGPIVAPLDSEPCRLSQQGVFHAMVHVVAEGVIVHSTLGWLDTRTAIEFHGAEFDFLLGASEVRKVSASRVLPLLVYLQPPAVGPKMVLKLWVAHPRSGKPLTGRSLLEVSQLLRSAERVSAPLFPPVCRREVMDAPAQAEPNLGKVVRKWALVGGGIGLAMCAVLIALPVPNRDPLGFVLFPVITAGFAGMLPWIGRWDRQTQRARYLKWLAQHESWKSATNSEQRPDRG